MAASASTANPAPDTLWPAPSANPHFTGHEAAEQSLLQAWSSGHLPQSWLLTGPAGIGKATLAYRFARFVLAGGAGARPGTLELAPDHPVFARIAAGGHADLRTLTPRFDMDRKRQRSHILVDDVRAAGRFMALTAAEGGWRILVVDAAEQMNVNAANALLKLLEEPPRDALLLLISHAPGRLPATIRSRCCRLALHPLDRASLTGLIARYQPDLDETAAGALAGLAEGSIGRALSLGEAGGLALYTELHAQLARMPGLDLPALHGLGERLARPNALDAFRTAAELLRWWLNRLIRTMATGTSPDNAEILAGEGETLRRLTDRGTLEQWLEVWDKVARLFAQAEGLNLDRKQAVLGAFFAIDRAARGS